MERIKKALGILAFITVMGGLQACADSPTAPSGHGDDPVCYWIDGILQCSPD